MYERRWFFSKPALNFDDADHFETAAATSTKETYMAPQEESERTEECTRSRTRRPGTAA